VAQREDLGVVRAGKGVKRYRFVRNGMMDRDFDQGRVEPQWGKETKGNEVVCLSQKEGRGLRFRFLEKKGETIKEICPYPGIRVGFKR